MLTHGSLFAGIGGFDLGFERAGIKTIWQVEIDEYCRKVLAKHFPEARRFSDIRECGKHNLPWVDVLSGGFPCQDISHAGKRVGIDGERSGLWSEYARIIGELRPRYVVIENVSALLSSGDWRDEPDDKCVCGWPYRWRGLHHHSASEDEIIFGAGGCGDVRKGNGVPEEIKSQFRRPHPKNAKEKRAVGGSICLGDIRESGGAVSQSDSAVPGIEETTSARSHLLAGDDFIAAVGEAGSGGLDSGSDYGSNEYSDFSSGTEPEGADRTADGRLLCPSCGRKVANEPTRHVFVSAMGRVLGDLAKIGYDAEWQSIRASDVGAPHRRERIWIVAYPKRCWRRQSPTYLSVLQESLSSPKRGKGPSVPGPSGKAAHTHTDASGCGRPKHSVQVHGPIIFRGWNARNDSGAVGISESVPDHDGSGFAQFQWQCSAAKAPGRTIPYADSWWAVEPGVDRVADGIPNVVDRLRGLGNAVVPQITEWIGRRLVEACR